MLYIKNLFKNGNGNIRAVLVVIVMGAVWTYQTACALDC
jgi:hypothetical protein